MRLTRASWLVLLTALVLVSGCSSKNKGKIEEAKWSSLATNVNGKQVDAGALQLEFASNGNLTYRIGPLSYTGTYSLGTGDNVTFKFAQNLGDRKEHVEKLTVNGEQMTMTDSDGTTVTFKKIN
jgi:hypothetical protein